MKTETNLRVELVNKIGGKHGSLTAQCVRHQLIQSILCREDTEQYDNQNIICSIGKAFDLWLRGMRRRWWLSGYRRALEETTNLPKETIKARSGAAYAALYAKLDSRTTNYLNKENRNEKFDFLD